MNQQSTKKQHIFENIFRTLKKDSEVCDMLRTEDVLRRNERARRVESTAGKGLGDHQNLVVLIMILQNNKKSKKYKNL